MSGKLFSLSGKAKAYIESERRLRGLSATSIVEHLMENSKWCVMWDRFELVNVELQKDNRPKQWQVDAAVYAQALYSLTLQVQKGNIEPQAATNGIMHILQNKEKFEEQRLLQIERRKQDLKHEAEVRAREKAHEELAELPPADSYVIDEE